MATPTHSVQIFVEIVRAVRAGLPLKPRSANNKEYFAQDWFIDRLKATGLHYQQQGRNSYPDFWAYDDTLQEGYESKSLAFVPPTPRQAKQGLPGKPARKDIDFNSTIPSGRKNDCDTFLVFFLHSGTGSANRAVHTLSLAHGDLINADHAVADMHINIAIKEFGAYGDGFIRNRKMYVFPHPVEIDPSGLGKCRLIVPAAWKLVDDRLKSIKMLSRMVAEQAIDSYKVSLHGGKATVRRKPYPNAGQQLEFQVFEAI
jgi:hypothetical protein